MLSGAPPNRRNRRRRRRFDGRIDPSFRSIGMIRLLMTADAVGGVWTYALDLADGLAAHNYAVTLAVLGPALRPDQRAAAEAVAGLTVVETGLPLDWTATKPAQVLAAGRAVAALAKRVGADLVHLNSPALAAGADFDIPVVGACHSCLATWWATVKGGEAPPSFRWRTELLAQGYARCDQLIAPSRAFAEATYKLYGVCPTAVLNGRRAPALDRDVERAPVALAAGRLWDEGKGASVLEAAARLARTRIEAAGPLVDPDGKRVKLKAVRSLGHLTQAGLFERMSRSRIFVSPGRYEPFGLTVLEAAQAGCALVLSDIPTFRELWDGVARFVPPNDSAALAAALDALMADDHASARLGEAARQHAARYDAENMARATAAAYPKVSARRARRGRPMEAVA